MGLALPAADELIVVEAPIIARFISHWPYYTTDLLAVLADILESGERMGLVRFQDRMLSPTVQRVIESDASKAMYQLWHADGFQTLPEADYWIKRLSLDLMEALDDVVLGEWDATCLWAHGNDREVVIGVRSRRL